MSCVRSFDLSCGTNSPLQGTNGSHAAVVFTFKVSEFSKFSQEYSGGRFGSAGTQVLRLLHCFISLFNIGVDRQAISTSSSSSSDDFRMCRCSNWWYSMLQRQMDLEKD